MVISTTWRIKIGWYNRERLDGSSKFCMQIQEISGSFNKGHESAGMMVSAIKASSHIRRLFQLPAKNKKERIQAYLKDIEGSVPAQNSKARTGLPQRFCGFVFQTTIIKESVAASVIFLL